MYTLTMNSLRATESLLNVLLRFLRHSLIEAPALERKIAVCDAIQDTAHAISSIAGQIADRERSREVLLTAGLMTVGCAAAAGVISEGANAISDLVACIDGECTRIQTSNPALSAVIRRAIETTARAFTIAQPAPKHDLDLHPEQLAISVADLPWPKLPDRSARESSSSVEETATGPPGSDLLQQLHWQIMGIEICAAEVCAAMALRFPDLPVELDLAARV
jgi:hypothetical protein